MNTKADMLSRQDDLEKGENDNQNMVVIPEERIAKTDTKEPGIEDECAMAKESEGEDIVKDFAADPRKWKQKENGTFWQENVLYIPNKEGLQVRLLHQAHDHPIAGHPGMGAMLDIMERKCYWPSIKKDVENYVKGCQDCQRNKAPQWKNNLLHPSKPAEGPWHTIHWDIVRPVKKS